MNAIDRARNAYASTSSPVRTGRAAELDLFRQTTARLKAAAQPPRSLAHLADALHANRRVWTHMAGEIADADNALPGELRARLFYLYEFVNAHTRKVLKNEADVGTLVEINSAVIRGLKGEGSV